MRRQFIHDRHARLGGQNANALLGHNLEPATVATACRRKVYEENVDDIFIFSYCAACHSSQGSIGQRKHYHSPMAVKIRYPRIAIDFNYKVRGCQKRELLLNPDFDEEMEINMYKRDFQNKVEGYKGQDRRKRSKRDT